MLLISRYPHWCRLIAMGTFLTGCQSIPPAPISTPLEHANRIAVYSPLISALIHVEQVSQWPDDKISQEVARLRADEDLERRLALALLLMRPDTPVRDDAQAMQLLASTHGLTEGDEAGLSFLRSLLRARVRDHERYRHWKKKWATERRMRAESERSNERVSLQLAREQEQSDRLQEQLEALKRIEQKINAREKPSEIPLDDVERIQTPVGR